MKLFSLILVSAIYRVYGETDMGDILQRAVLEIRNELANYHPDLLFLPSGLCLGRDASLCYGEEDRCHEHGHICNELDAGLPLSVVYF